MYSQQTGGGGSAVNALASLQTLTAQNSHQTVTQSGYYSPKAASSNAKLTLFSFHLAKPTRVLLQQGL